MALNPYSRPAEQKILPYNTDLIAGLAEYNQKRYDTASAEYDDLLGSFNKIPLGRGERAQTFDLSVPNRARYQLRHTPIGVLEKLYTSFNDLTRGVG